MFPGNGPLSASAAAAALGRLAVAVGAEGHTSPEAVKIKQFFEHFRKHSSKYYKNASN